MAKLDLKEVYRAVPVHPDDQPLLGMRWKDQVFIDATLPFGLRSAPKIFSALADALLWILHLLGHTNTLHYLDDYLLVGPPSSPSCREALASACSLAVELGLEIAEEKTEGPTSCLTFLGIKIDSAASMLRLPKDKLANLKLQLARWLLRDRPRHSRTKRELLSLLGLLNHAASVVKPGRTFICSLIDASTAAKHLDHYVHLSAQARADLTWWHTFVQSWNGKSLLPEPEPAQSLYSDASGSWGFGALSEHDWFSAPWTRTDCDGGGTLGPSVTRCFCNNQAVVCALNKSSAKDPQLMRLLRSLFFFCASYNISVSACHIPGAHNSPADALSRDHIPLFHSLQPHASPLSSPIPDALSELVLNRALRWTSSSWTRLFEDILNHVSPQPRGPPTAQLSAAFKPSVSHTPLPSN